MKTKKIIKLMLLSLLALGMVVYVAYAMIFLSGPDGEEKCVAVEYIMEGDEESKFINESDMENMLKDAHVYPKGMLMKDVNTRKIEDVIRNNEFISKVECYKSANGKMCIKVEQRVPVMLVLPDGRNGYFVDAHGKIIPYRNNVSNLVVASGSVSDQFASTELSEFGKFLQTDEFWNNQIEQIYVTKNAKGKEVVELIPRVGDQVIHLGSLENYERKLRKMRTFYDNAIDKVGWKKYAKVDLEYDEQIICAKR